MARYPAYIEYTEKMCDGKYEYRTALLPKEVYKEIKDKIS